MSEIYKLICPQFIAFTFDQATGLLKSMTNLESKETISLYQTFGYYIGSVGNNSKESLRASGAYIVCKVLLVALYE